MPSRLSLRSFFSRRDWRDDLSAYLDGELAPRDRERVEAQLAESDQMREYLADLQDMRTALRGFAPAASASPFQLTSEILERGVRAPLVASGATRALRMSMATAAVGVAAFAAVMVFDVIDSPTVTFTTTQAGDMSNSVPTAQVVTEEVESQSGAEPEVAAVTEVSSGAEQPGRGEPTAAEAEQAEPEATVASLEVEAQEQEMELAAQQAEEEEWQAEQTEQAQSAESAASDPSRQGLTAGRGAAEVEEDGAQDVTAADVVAQEEADAVEDDAEVSQPTEEVETASASTEEEAAESEAASPVDDDRDDETPSVEAQAETERHTVARSVRHTESDWPLEERPRSNSVELATDPSWERPVQIVLAAFAVATTTFWLTLAIVDRRRRT